MFGENNYDVARELSKEEIQEFYNLVIEAVREQTDFGVISPSNIKLKGGKIYVVPQNGSYHDVTDIVLQTIHSLGNGYFTREIEGEVNETIRRKY